MRRPFALLAVLSIVSVASAQVTNALTRFVKVLQDAKALQASYSYQTIGSAPGDYRLVLKKPDLARIDTPTRIFVNDGKKLTVYDKTRKLFYKVDSTPKGLKDLFVSDELALYRGFFDASTYLSGTTWLPSKRVINGTNYDVLETRSLPSGRKTVTYYFDPSDGLAKKSQIEVKDPRGAVSGILDVRTVQLDPTVPDDAFTFKAPEGSREVSIEEFGARWYDNLIEAESVAARTNRKLFVIFDEDDSEAMQKMNREVLNSPDFLKYAKQFVFVRIAPSKDKKTADKYEVKVVPTFYILDAKGEVIDSREGYAGRALMLNWLSAQATK